MLLCVTDWNQKNNCLMMVSRQLLRLQLNRYLETLMYSLLTLVWVLPPLLLLHLLKKDYNGKGKSELESLVLLSLIAHIVHVIFVSAVNIMHLRYYLPTFCSVLFAVIINATEIWRSRERSR